MSVDPEQPSAPDPATPKPPAEGSGESAEALRLKRRFKRGGVDADDEEKPDQTIQLLSTLLQDLIAKKELPLPAEVEIKTGKYHRLSKTGTGASAPPPETPGPVANIPAPAPSAGRPPPEAPATSLPTPPTVTFRPAPVREPGFRMGWPWLSLLGLLALLGLAYFTVPYFRPAATGPRAGTKPLAIPAGAWTDAMLTELDQALAADQAGDIKGAQRLASAIRKPDSPAPPGLDLYLASLTTRLDHYYDVEADLLRAVAGAPPEETAAINEGLAFNFSRARDFEKAADFFKVASRTDPFPAPLFYHWGEALRHLGQFQEATVSFRRALDRIPTGQPENESLRSCVNLKLRLALLELGRESEFQSDMAEQLKAPLASGYWLLTAAAVALQRKNLPDAVDALGRARDALGPAQFNLLLNDYFFRAYADRKELADFFPTDPAARRAGLLPTRTYSVEP